MYSQVVFPFRCRWRFGFKIDDQSIRRWWRQLKRPEWVVDFRWVVAPVKVVTVRHSIRTCMEVRCLFFWVVSGRLMTHHFLQLKVAQVVDRLQISYLQDIVRLRQVHQCPNCHLVSVCFQLCALSQIINVPHFRSQPTIPSPLGTETFTAMGWQWRRSQTSATHVHAALVTATTTTTKSWPWPSRATTIASGQHGRIYATVLVPARNKSFAIDVSFDFYFIFVNSHEC